MRALDFLFFCRPLLLIPVWTIFLFLYDFSFPEIKYLGVVFGQSSFPTFQLMNLIVISGLTSSGYIINQIYDRESDRINGKLGFFEAPVSLSVTSAWILYVVLALIAFAFAASHPALYAPYVVSLIAGALYSVPPCKGKDKPLTGLVLNAIPYSVIIWWALIAEGQGTFSMFRDTTTPTVLALTSLALALAGIYLLTTVPDVAGDRKTDKRTISVQYGPRKAIYGAIGFLIGAGVFGALANSPALYLTAVLATALALLALRTNKSNHVLLAAKAPILALSLVECYRHPLYGVFLLALIVLTRVYYKYRFGLVYPKLA